MEYNKILNDLLGCQGCNVSSISDFIEEMSEANNSGFYTEERQSTFRALEITEVMESLNGGILSGLRISSLKHRILAADSAELNDDYF